MKRILLSLMALVCLSALLVIGCSSTQEFMGNGIIIDRQFAYKSFNTVEISNAIEYEINQASYYSVVTTSSSNLIYQLDLSQSGQTLIVALKPGNYNNSHFKVTITMPTLTKLVVSGASRGNIAGFDSVADFELVVQGASQCDLEGSAGKADIRVVGASRLYAADFSTLNANVTVQGASIATVHSQGTLNVDVDGVSTLNYRGNPVLGTVNVNGLSHLVRE